MELKKIFAVVENTGKLTTVLEAGIRSGLELYLQSATEILEGSGIRPVTTDPTFFSLEKNFFSALFLYAYLRLGIPSGRRVLYAACNQCLRGMVTGCDNILDDEYKKNLDTDLPAEAARFRSVLDIMVSDRVLYEIMISAAGRSEITPAQAIEAGRASLRALTLSGVQEASEENGITTVLEPQAIISQVHHFKTGLLFVAALAIPAAIEEGIPAHDLTAIERALYNVGMGCQLLDDMVDFERDLAMKRHNYMISTIYHGNDPAETERMKALIRENGVCPAADFAGGLRQTAIQADRYLTDGLENLFAAEHAFMIEPARKFITARIGTDRLIDA